MKIDANDIDIVIDLDEASERNREKRKEFFDLLYAQIGRKSSARPDGYAFTSIGDVMLRNTAENWCVLHRIVSKVYGPKYDILGCLAQYKQKRLEVIQKSIARDRRFISGLEVLNAN